MCACLDTSGVGVGVADSEEIGSQSPAGLAQCSRRVDHCARVRLALRERGQRVCRIGVSQISSRLRDVGRRDGTNCSRQCKGAANNSCPGIRLGRPWLRTIRGIDRCANCSVGLLESGTQLGFSCCGFGSRNGRRRRSCYRCARWTGRRRLGLDEMDDADDESADNEACDGHRHVQGTSGGLFHSGNGVTVGQL